MLYQDSFHSLGRDCERCEPNWLKASVEYENEDFQHLGNVVTNQGYSDWARVELSPDVKTVTHRLSRRQQDFKIEYSLDGVTFH